MTNFNKNLHIKNTFAYSARVNDFKADTISCNIYT